MHCGSIIDSLHTCNIKFWRFDGKSLFVDFNFGAVIVKAYFLGKGDSLHELLNVKKIAFGNKEHTTN